MKVHAIQHEIAWEDKPATHARALRLIEQAGPSPGGFVVLAEMFSTGFSMNVAAIAEDENGPTHGFLRDVAKRFGVFVVGGVVTRSPDGRGRNEAVVISPTGEKVMRYQKIKTFTPGGESDHYERGKHIAGLQWHGIGVCPFICYDLRFPELFREATRHGAEVLLIMASWPSARTYHWSSLLTARAIENQCYVVGVNRCGSDPKFQYDGKSAIIGPDGRLIMEAGSGEQALSAEIDIEKLREYRRKLPFLADM